MNSPSDRPRPLAYTPFGHSQRWIQEAHRSLPPATSQTCFGGHMVSGQLQMECVSRGWLIPSLNLGPVTPGRSGMVISDFQADLAQQIMFHARQLSTLPSSLGPLPTPFIPSICPISRVLIHTLVCVLVLGRLQIPCIRRICELPSLHVICS